MRSTTENTLELDLSDSMLSFPFFYITSKYETLLVALINHKFYRIIKKKIVQFELIFL
jgi:hypothetical protein